MAGEVRAVTSGHYYASVAYWVGQLTRTRNYFYTWPRRWHAVKNNERENNRHFSFLRPAIRAARNSADQLEHYRTERHVRIIVNRAIRKRIFERCGVYGDPKLGDG